jgi:hypothetical protein
MLVEAYGLLLDKGWQSLFRQARTQRRALEHALALPAVLGRRTVSRTICALGRSDQDWSADYKLYSRSAWSSQSLFDPILEDYLIRYRQGPIGMVFDDTRLAKTGKKVPGASWGRDPMSPPFQVNLLWGVRFLQAGLLFPHHGQGDVSARSLPVRFEEAPVVKKPGKRASKKERQAYRELKKQRNLSVQTLQMMRDLRRQLDSQGAAPRRLLATLDGSFCNRTLFKADLDRIELLARCRKDARLCFPAPSGQRRRYSTELFTPEQVRQDPGRPWKRTRIHLAGQFRWVRYKQVAGVLWQRGAGLRSLLLIVVAPQPYRLSRHAPRNYREPAYLLTNDSRSSIKRLMQTYLDRWQIEVNHRDEKSLLGVGQAQVHSAQSVPRHPAFVVACYSALLLASLRCFGPTRTADYQPLPKWRRNVKRPSLLDLLTLLRKELHETPVSFLIPSKLAQNLMSHAYT